MPSRKASTMTMGERSSSEDNRRARRYHPTYSRREGGVEGGLKVRGWVSVRRGDGLRGVGGERMGQCEGGLIGLTVR